MYKGVITDIQRASIHDGPGIRTTVFLKGCPLHCEWCHNPECIDFQPQTMFYPDKCIGCGMCHMGCFAGARVQCGREVTTEDVLREIMQDQEYYGTEGGVTFSGGEPMAQREFLSELIDSCRERGIHCAVETSMIYYDEEIFRKLNLVMADLKIWDEKTHIKYTGVSNQKIIEHLKMIDKLNVPIIVRTPVIPEINQEIDKISAFARKLKNVMKYELLPYHPLGESKYAALRKTLTGQQEGGERAVFTTPTKEYMKELEKYVFIRRQIAGNA